MRFTSEQAEVIAKALIAAEMERDEALALAEREMDETTGPADKAFEEANTAAKKVYDETVAKAAVVYDKAYDEASETRKRIWDLALLKFRETRDPAQKAYDELARLLRYDEVCKAYDGLRAEQENT